MMSFLKFHKNSDGLNIWAVVLAAIFLAAPIAMAQSDYSKSVRGSALGDGFAALANEPGGVFYNAAGIGFLKGYQATVSFSRISAFNMAGAENPYSGLLGGSYYREGWGTFGFNAYQMGSFYSNTLLNTTNNVTMTYARLLNPALAGGFNFKYVFESNYGKRQAMDFDLGVLYKASEAVGIGLAVENLFHNEMIPQYGNDNRFLDRIARLAVSYSTEDPEEPTSFVSAIGVKQQELQGARENYGLVSVGVEQWFRNDFPLSWALRGTYNMSKEYGENLRQFAVGLSLRFNNVMNFWRIDYCFQDYPFEGASTTTGNHLVSAVFGLGDAGAVPSLTRNKSAIPSEEQLSQEYAALEPANPLSQSRRIQHGEALRKDYAQSSSDNNEWNKMNLHGRVEDLSSSRLTRYMFILQPGFSGRISAWKVFIHDRRPKPTGLENMEKRAVKVLSGQGTVPGVIVWDGKNKDYFDCGGGRYYYSLVVWDADGRIWRSSWYDFPVR